MNASCHTRSQCMNCTASVSPVLLAGKKYGCNELVMVETCCQKSLPVYVGLGGNVGKLKWFIPKNKVLFISALIFKTNFVYTKNILKHWETLYEIRLY